MTCADLEIALCDYLDGTLAPAGKAEVEHHLSACAACGELARDAGAALGFIERVPEIEPPPELVTRMYGIPALGGGRAPAGHWSSAGWRWQSWPWSRKPVFLPCSAPILREAG